MPKNLTLNCPNISSHFSGFDMDLINETQKRIDQAVEPLLNQFVFKMRKEKLSTTKLNSTAKSFKELSLDILDTYYERLEIFNAHISKVQFLFPLSLLFATFSAIKYMNLYLRRDHYKNFVLGVKFYELDEKRKSLNQPSLLPLSDYLKEKYVGIFDAYMTDREINITFNSIVALIITLVPIYMAMACDHFLFSVTVYLKTYGKLEINIEDGNDEEIFSSKNVQGQGFTSDVFRELMNVFSRVTPNSQNINRHHFK